MNSTESRTSFATPLRESLPSIESDRMRPTPLLALVVLAGLLIGAADVPGPFDPVGTHTNGLGMQFVHVPDTDVQFSTYQTRVKDYRAFIHETGYIHMRETADPESRMWSVDVDGQKRRGYSWDDLVFKQTPDDPVVGVSWQDAKAFCEWLTLRERAAGRLPPDREYRLPTDREWSVAVGLEEKKAGETEEEFQKKTPAEKDQATKGYPWGPESAWPPPQGTGNYAGTEANDEHWPAAFPSYFPTIPGYRDAYARTAPVGSFKPNRLGLYDLGSNVLECCEDIYQLGGDTRTYRGASWRDGDPDSLRSSNRRDGPPGRRYDRLGFRCVIGPHAPKQ
jgi:formylglycine-generating enzyme required for sulfatase activity